MSEKTVFTAAVIVSSDRAAKGVYRDESGPAVETWLKAHHFSCAPTVIIEDDPSALEAALARLLPTSDIVVISGGSGLGPRDITPQALDRLCDWNIPGFGELLRRESEKHSPNTWLSRCGAWAKNQKLILALPGNPTAAIEQLDILDDLLAHAIFSLRGECRHRHTHEPSHHGKIHE